MSTSEPPIVSLPAPERAKVPYGDALELEKLQRFVERQVQDALALRDQDAALRERATRYFDLLKLRRRLRSSIKMREDVLRHDKRQLEEVEEELGGIPLPARLRDQIDRGEWQPSSFTHK